MMVTCPYCKPSLKARGFGHASCRLCLATYKVPAVLAIEYRLFVPAILSIDFDYTGLAHSQGYARFSEWMNALRE